MEGRAPPRVTLRVVAEAKIRQPERPPLSPLPPRPSPEDLGELVDKYRLLVDLRRGAAGRTEERRQAMRAIAERFPGGLREWDRASLAVLERRRGEAERALARSRVTPPAGQGDQATAPHGAPGREPDRLDGRAEPAKGPPADDGCGDDTVDPAWIRLSARYHRELREALAAKRWLAGRALTPEVVAVAATLGIDGERLKAIAAPPSGKVSELVLGQVAAAEGVSIEALKRALDPSSSGPAAAERGEDP